MEVNVMQATSTKALQSQVKNTGLGLTLRSIKGHVDPRPVTDTRVNLLLLFC